MVRLVVVLMALVLLVQGSAVRGGAQISAHAVSGSDHITSQGPDSSLRPNSVSEAARNAVAESLMAGARCEAKP